MSKFSIIITAGGIGKRMGASLPKQFIQINEKPILMYTIEQFYHYDPKAQLLLTLPEDWRTYWEELIEENDFRIPHRVVSGGVERYDSIKNALQFCHGEYIAVHDGVRPLVTVETIERCFKAVKKKKAVIPIMSVKESLRYITKEGTRAVNRAEYCNVQTPQCFEKDVLVRAYEMPFNDAITDDACLVELNGTKIHTVPGNDENIKITNQTDLALAEHLLK